MNARSNVPKNRLNERSVETSKLEKYVQSDCLHSHSLTGPPKAKLCAWTWDSSRSSVEKLVVADRS